MPDEKLSVIMNSLRELESDVSLPKNVKTKMSCIIRILEENSETQMKVSRALHELEGITDDSTTPSFTRMQLFNIASMLEVV